MGDRRILTVVIGDACSLCDRALDAVRSPARLMGVQIVTEGLDAGDNRERFGTRVPVVLGASGKVLCEGRIRPMDAWRAVLRGRFARSAGRESGGPADGA